MEEKKNKRKENIKDLISYIIIILLVVIIRVFIFDPVKVDGPSMNTTLENGQILILDKFKYRKDEIQRYDIVVVKLDNKKIIKRVIGLPNETIEVQNNKVFANSVEVDNSFTSSKTDDFKLEDIGLLKVPGDSYFVMGDNRAVSLDSRYPEVGTIKRDRIIGKAVFRIWPLNKIGKVK